jgi:hypothetical protein
LTRQAARRSHDLHRCRSRPSAVRPCSRPIRGHPLRVFERNQCCQPDARPGESQKT